MSKASSNKKSKSCEEKQTMKFLACIYFCMSVILFAVLFLGQMCQFVWPKRTNCCTFLRKIEQGNVKGNHTPKKKKKIRREILKTIREKILTSRFFQKHCMRFSSKHSFASRIFFPLKKYVNLNGFPQSQNFNQLLYHCDSCHIKKW